MPFKNVDNEQELVNIQKRIVKQLFLKTGEFNKEMKHIPMRDKTEFNELFMVLQKEFAKNRAEELLAKLVLWKKTFLKLEEMCEKTNLFEKLEKMAQIEDPLIIKEFTKFAKNITFDNKNRAENLFSFFCQVKNKLLIQWLMVNESFLTLCANKVLTAEKLAFYNSHHYIKYPLPIVTKNFIQAIEHKDIDFALFLLENQYVWISLEHDINDEIMQAVLNSNHPQLIQTMIEKNFLQHSMKKKIMKYNSRSATVFDWEIFIYLRKFILTNNIEVVAKLFDNGLPVDCKDYVAIKMNFLTVALLQKTINTELVELLVTRGADLKVLFPMPVGENKWREVTPLIYAISKKNYNLAHRLIELNENAVMYNTSDNISPLMFIIYYNGPNDLMEKIVATKKETLYTVQKSDGSTPLLYALREQDTEKIKILLTADPELVNKPIVLGKAVYSPLMAAINKDNINYEVVELLLQSGADVNHKIPQMHFVTAFLNATCFNKLEIMKLLHKYGADINPIDGEYLTPLARVIWRKETLISVKNFFYENNITLNSHSADGHTMLTLASKNSSTTFVQKVYKKYQIYGIDINSPDKDGNTPLHWALKTDNASLAKILIINYKAKVDVANNKGVSALDLIQASKNEEIKNIFKEEDNSVEEVVAPPLPIPMVLTSTSPIVSKRNFYFKKQKNELGVKPIFAKPNSNSRKSSHQETRPALENEETKKTNTTGKINQQTRSNANYQPCAEKIIKSLNYMAKKQVQDRLRAEEQKRRKAEQKEKVAVKVLENEEQNISNLEQSENNNEYYQFIAKLREKLAVNIDNDFYVVKRANGIDHEGGRPAIKIYESKGSKNKQILFAFISSIKEGKKPAQSLTFSLENDRDSYLREINWADKNEVIGKWKTLNVENKVQPKVTTAHKVEIANLVTLEHLQTIFATEFIDFNYKQTKAKFEQINLGATTSGAIAQPVNTEQFSFPECLAKSTVHYDNNNDFYYQKIKNATLNKKLNIGEINKEDEQVLVPQKVSFITSSNLK